jgi:prepilin-type N-terminal cleavage/methylation domain-containing protein/prepilin-type processing-associated H-X9-DG protein
MSREIARKAACPVVVSDVPGVRTRGFTLVEVLVVVALLAVLIALLIPAVGGARDAAKTMVCAGNMRQQGMLLATYNADCKGYVAMPVTQHTLDTQVPMVTNLGATTSHLCTTCPLGAGKTYPVGYGWFYALGYLPATTAKSKVPLMQCPDAGMYVNSTTLMQYSEAQYKEYSLMTTTLAKPNSGTGMYYTNPQGGGSTWDCINNGARIDYAFRGWWNPRGTNQKKAINWKPGDAVAVDYEFYNGSNTREYAEMHGDGLNILFFDGRVQFGGKDLGGHKPFVYYSMIKEARTESQAKGSNNPHSGGAYSTGDGRASQALWAYYSTGVPQ